MKTIQLLAAFFILAITATTQAQTADEILTNYFENTGGTDNWKAIKGMQMNGIVKTQGVELPFEQILMADGRSYSKANFQGQDFYQDIYDGETLWNTNQISQKAEKSDAETTANRKLDSNDFPDKFLNYKEKGYTLELIGKETIEGTETFKIKLTMEPKIIDGQEVPSIVFVYFDTENYVPIVEEQEIISGPSKGQISVNKFSDYEEVNGLYFPFSIIQSVKDNPAFGQFELVVKSIEFNPEVSDDIFAFPEQ